jgi:hypothetical protein
MTLYSNREKQLLNRIKEAERERIIESAKAEADRQFQMMKPILMAKLGASSDMQRRKRLTHHERTEEAIDLVAKRKHQREIMFSAETSDPVFDDNLREVQKLAEKVDQKAGK